MARPKLLYVCLDGLGDEPNPELGDLTPLEAASTPFLDDLAKRGSSGLVTTVGKDIAPESDIAVFAILGYDPTEEHPGRGVLEAIGTGMDFRDGDLAHRVNFSTADGEQILDRRVARDLTSEEATELANEVNRELKLPAATFELRASVEHRGALVIKSGEGRLSSAVSNTDPAYAKVGTLGVALETFEDKVAWSEPLEETEEARRAAELTNEFVRVSAGILDASEVNARRRSEGRLPANLILTRDAGDHVPTLQPIKDRFGPEWGCFVEMPVERGIAMLLGMGEVAAPSTPDPAQRYSEWAALAAEALGGCDALYVHIKGPDIPAHDGRALDKRDICEVIDGSFFAEIAARTDPSQLIVAVTADHATSCVRKAHTADPVPIAVSGAGVRSDGVASFGERAASDGSIGHIRGVDILPRLSSLMAS
ncbi:MAG: 2,3-bisphosphoglycerate-independent phosphoglycerate mutase [Actinomycetota bacterium]